LAVREVVLNETDVLRPERERGVGYREDGNHDLIELPALSRDSVVAEKK
jgi:hypothetical protein